MSFDPMEKLAVNPADRWLFRWVFHYSNGRISKRGGWHPASRFEDMAHCQSREFLSHAEVEGKHFTTREVRTFASIPGEDFINFQHLAVHFQRAGYILTHVYGMRIIHRKGMISCFENGELLLDERHYSELNLIMPESTKL